MECASASVAGTRWLRPDDGLAVDILYAAYRDRAECPRAEAFIKNAERYELAYMMHGEKIMGVAMRLNGCVHIGVIPAWRRRWATRGFIRAILDWAAQSGHVWTAVAPGNAVSERLVNGVGFVERGGRYELHNQP